MHTTKKLNSQGYVLHHKGEHQKALAQLRQEITTQITLPYFNRSKHTTLQIEASKKGFGAVILQDNKPIYFASRSLTAAEKNYQNLERECMAAIWQMEKFYFFPIWQRILATNGPKASYIHIQETPH